MRILMVWMSMMALIQKPTIGVSLSSLSVILSLKSLQIWLSLVFNQSTFYLHLKSSEVSLPVVLLLSKIPMLFRVFVSFSVCLKLHLFFLWYSSSVLGIPAVNLLPVLLSLWPVIKYLVELVVSLLLVSTIAWMVLLVKLVGNGFSSLKV